MIDHFRSRIPQLNRFAPMRANDPREGVALAARNAERVQSIAAPRALQPSVVRNEQEESENDPVWVLILYKKSKMPKCAMFFTKKNRTIFYLGFAPILNPPERTKWRN